MEILIFILKVLWDIDWGNLFAGVILGFILGMFGDFFVSLCLSYSQFSSSIAGHRVKSTARATDKICEAIEPSKDQSKQGKPTEQGKTTEKLRNIYRYSLGVAIDNLAGAFGTKPNDKFQENGPWPSLVEKDCFDDPGKDRWDWFNQRVKPVTENIDDYSFLGKYHFLLSLFHKKELSQLDALVKLCNQLETVVCELDAILEARNGKGKPLWIKLNKDERIEPTDAASDQVKQLREEYRKLHQAWQKWLPLVRDCNV